MVAHGNVPGLTEGPLTVIKALATNPAVQQLMGVLALLYPAKLKGDGATAGAITGQINPVGGRNYSPTFFLINAMLEPTDPERKFDYVATIIFASKL